MTTIGKEISARPWSLWYPQRTRDIWHGYAHAQLSRAFEAAKAVSFDDSSRIVFFSDLHRGGNGRTDAFAPNEALFLHALNDYYQKGFTYVEVGDGDELWQHRRFQDIRRAHGDVFDLMHQFYHRDRLHILIGNHDIQNKRRRPTVKDGLPVHEGVRLRHVKTGQRIFVVHGHQADFTSSRLHGMSRFAVRYIWKNLRLLSFGSALSREKDVRKKWGRFGGQVMLWVRMQLTKIEQRIVSWVQAQRQMIICGHTHRPMGAAYAAPPYFNTGCCVVPGTFTGIEIQNGEIALVQWSVDEGRGLLSRPKKLGYFHRPAAR